MTLKREFSHFIKFTEFLEIGQNIFNFNEFLEFVTSHKLPENVAKPLDDDDEYIDEKKVAFKDNKQTKKVTQKFENVEKKAAILEPARRLDLAEEDDLDSLTAKRQAQVELENFSDTGKVLQEGRIKKIDSKRPRPAEQDEVIPGVYVR